jgi:hypothetical protein
MSLSLKSHALRIAPTLTVLSAALALSACGGGDDNVAAPPASNPPPATVSTTVTGAVVKGPVAAAQVCGYAVAANARGAALGSCTTSDASGNYSLTVPTGSGPLWVEATGGTYTDETTASATSLPAGSALRAIVTANGGSVTTMLTPLTTLALNAAAATAGSGGTLDSAAFSAAAAALISSFKLPADLNISSTLPTFGAGINTYGTALTAISKMVANGQTLASILAAAQPSTLAAAYATAAAPVVPPVGGGGTGGGTGGGGTLGPITATGSVTGSTTETFVPRAFAASGEPAFSTLLTARGEGYTFVNTNATGLTTQVISYSVTRGQASSALFFEYSYTGGLARAVARVCKAPCAGITLTPTASGTGVTLTFTNASFELTDFGTTLPNPPTAPSVLNGSLTGETPGGYVFAAQMPRGTTGTLSLDGVATPIFFADISYPTAPSITDPLAYPIVALNTARGTFTVDRRPESPPYFAAAFISKPEGEGLVKVVTADALTSTANGYAINLTNLAMTGSGPTLKTLSVTAQVNTGKAGGTVTIAGDDSFTARLDILQAQNQTLFYNFRGTSKTLAFSNIDVRIKDGAVTYFNANSPSGKGYTCDSVGSLFSAKCVGSISVSADKRTLTFNGFKAGKTMTPNADVAFEGSLTAAGF